MISTSDEPEAGGKPSVCGRPGRTCNLRRGEIFNGVVLTLKREILNRLTHGQDIKKACQFGKAGGLRSPIGIKKGLNINIPNRYRDTRIEVDAIEVGWSSLRATPEELIKLIPCKGPRVRQGEPPGPRSGRPRTE